MSSHLILVTSDLVVGSRVAPAASTAGWSFATVASLERLREVGFEPVPERILVVVQLQGTAAAGSTAVDAFKQRYPAARFVAFGPHVHTALLQQAADGSYDAVWTNGQLHRAIASGEFPSRIDLW